MVRSKVTKKILNKKSKKDFVLKIIIPIFEVLNYSLIKPIHMEILSKVLAGSNKVEQVKSQMFTVYDLPTPTPTISDLETLPTNEQGDIITFELPSGTPNLQTIDTVQVWNDRGHYLGQAGRTYKSVQPVDFLDNIERSLILGNIEGVKFDQIEYYEYKQGQIIEFRIPMDPIELVNMNGKKEQTDVYISFRTGFGGTAKSTIGLFLYRLVCSNGMKAWSMDHGISVKHTRNNNTKLDHWAKDIAQEIERAQWYIDTLKKTSQHVISGSDRLDFVHTILNYSKEEINGTVEPSAQKVRKKIELQQAIDQEIAIAGGCAYSLLQGVTRWTNHTLAKDQEFLQVGTGLKLNDLAQKLVFDMVK